MNRELRKWKEKYKMLRTYKNEEDMAFKSKFDYLNEVEDERTKLKSMISAIKYAPQGAVYENEGDIHFTKKE
jgi:hypothetical protein